MMMPSKTLSFDPTAFAQQRARALLAAWNSGNLARLEAELDANSAFMDMPLPPIERERIEIVGEVVDAIRGWISRVRTETELQAALLLLRHVGRIEPAYIPSLPNQERRSRTNYSVVLTGSRSI
jgi:hypothetical protein